MKISALKNTLGNLITAITVILSCGYTIAYGEGGVINLGGGNPDSRQIRRIEAFFQNNGLVIRTEMIQWLQGFHRFQSQGVISEKLNKMIDGGLLEDIQKSPFVLSEECRDEKGSIKAMSTIRVNNFKLNKPVHPKICINVPLLARENSENIDIVGNLMHEFGRHFGFEDTEKFGKHPMALYVANLYYSPSVTLPILMKTVVTAQPSLRITDSSYGFHVDSSPESRLKIQVIPTSENNNCSELYILMYNEYSKNSYRLNLKQLSNWSEVYGQSTLYTSNSNCKVDVNIISEISVDGRIIESKYTFKDFDSSSSIYFQPSDLDLTDESVLNQ